MHPLSLRSVRPPLLRVYRDRENLPIRIRLLVTFGAVAGLHLAALVLLVAGWASSAVPLTLGLAVTAYTAGIKHSYDWDHIAAIDNSTRKFVAQRKDPVSTGFAFSLGHSSVVTLAGLLLVTGATLMGRLMEADTTESKLLTLIGTGVSGVFLLTMSLFSGSALVAAARAYRKVRAGGTVRDEDLATTGLVARMIAKPLSRVDRPRSLYALGFLFGLGFDTATTIGLLVTTATASLAGASPWTLMALPLAFTSAMTLCDSANGVAMMKLYKSAIENPGRKLGLNVVITAISALSALIIAIITLSAFANTAFALNDPVTTWISRIDLGDAGLAVVALFIVAAAVSAWRNRRKDGPPR